MATKRLQKREEFDLVEHLTRNIGEMLRTMGLYDCNWLEVENQRVAKDYHIKGVDRIKAVRDPYVCHGLMPYLVMACGDNLYLDSKTMKSQQLINIHNYVVYAFNKFVDEGNRRHCWV